MAARLILGDREYEVKAGRTILYTLIQLRIDVRVVRPMRDGELIDMQEIIRDGDTIKLVPLVSGG
jgi:sulfur carrier protein ThiS